MNFIINSVTLTYKNKNCFGDVTSTNLILRKGLLGLTFNKNNMAVSGIVCTKLRTVGYNNQCKIL